MRSPARSKSLSGRLDHWARFDSVRSAATDVFCASSSDPRKAWVAERTAADVAPVLPRSPPWPARTMPARVTAADALPASSRLFTVRTATPY
jgi:hypothetical protein